jgi:hypothetical protein
MILLMLLSLMTAANAPYSTVLCLGPGGHVAIEPAGHNHCRPATDGQDSPAGLADPSGPPDDEHNHCCPCTDIPISAGTSKHQIVPGTSRIDLLDLLATPALAGLIRDDGTHSSASASTGLLTSCYLSLRSVVLQV